MFLARNTNPYILPVFLSRPGHPQDIIDHIRNNQKTNYLYGYSGFSNSRITNYFRTPEDSKNSLFSDLVPMPNVSYPIYSSEGLHDQVIRAANYCLARSKSNLDNEFSDLLSFSEGTDYYGRTTYTCEIKDNVNTILLDPFYSNTFRDCCTIYPKEFTDLLTGDIPKISTPSKFTFTSPYNFSYRSSGRIKSKWATVYNSPAHIDSFSHFSFLEDTLTDADLETFLSSYSDTDIQCFYIPDLFRGNGQPTVEITSVKGSKLAKDRKYIFPFIANVDFLDPGPENTDNSNRRPYSIVKKQVLLLGSFDSMSRYYRYTRSTRFIGDFVTSLFTLGGARFLDPQRYEKYINKIYGKHIRYWSGIRKIYKRDILPTYDPAFIEPTNTLHTEDLYFIGAQSSILKSDKSIAYKEIDKIYTDKSTELSSISGSLDRNLSRESVHQSDIDSYQRQINILQTNIDSIKKENDALRKQKQDVIATLESLKDEHATLKQDFEDQIKDIQPDVEYSNKLIQNLASTGIIIEDIIYLDTDTGASVSIQDNSRIPLECISSDPRYSLRKITFRTTKPVVIRVDYGRKGENCKKVAGGPYICTIQPNSIYISLASSMSCFGYEESTSYGWVHPHTGYFYINPESSWEDFSKSIIDHRATGCLGEASPLLYKAFERNDIKMAIWSAMTWITNANSTDTWGKNYKFFPLAEEVNFEPKSSINEDSYKIDLASEDGINSIIEQMTAVYDEDDDEDDDDDEEDEEVNEEDNLDDRDDYDDQDDYYYEDYADDNPNNTQNLRRPGVQGYRPYNT